MMRICARPSMGCRSYQMAIQIGAMNRNASPIAQSQRRSSHRGTDMKQA